MVNRADNGSMLTLLIIFVVLAAVVGAGLLAVQYGADSRHTDPRDLRHSWY
jgi:hypothetical protein